MEKPYSITRALLEHIAENGPLIIDALIPYHPRSRMARALLGLDRERYTSAAAAKHSYSSILNRLKQEGLVERGGPKNQSRWSITRKGRIVLRQKPKVQKKSPDHLAYPALPREDGITRLITFDIPEKQRAKRNWLRQELLACGYSLLHKSVFIGKRPLPEELAAMIETLHLGAYIHFVGIDRKGTLMKNA